MTRGPRPRNFVQPRRPGSRRARQGVKPEHDVAALRQHAVAGPWIAALEASCSAAARADGDVLAREGLVMSLEIRPGVIEGAVQPARPTPHLPTGTMQPPGEPGTGKPGADCRVAVHVPIHDESTWQRAVQSLSADRSAAAPILAGELPEDLDLLLARHGAPLVPRPGEAVTMTCSCHAGTACAHLAALIVLAADRMQSDPTQTLLLRGLAATEFIERVRQARAAAARQSAASPATHTDERAAEPLAELSLEEFWRTGPEFDDLAHLPPPNHAPHALLRRLGPSPLGGTFPLVGLLASAYDTIKAHADKMRDDAEGTDA